MGKILFALCSRFSPECKDDLPCFAILLLWLKSSKWWTARSISCFCRYLLPRKFSPLIIYPLDNWHMSNMVKRLGCFLLLRILRFWAQNVILRHNEKKSFFLDFLRCFRSIHKFIKKVLKLQNILF